MEADKLRASQPLKGVTVLDFTTLLPGPLATLMLAEAGAHVIKIERPGGEDMRRFAPFIEGRSVLFEQLNHGKEIRHLDLKDEADRADLDGLLSRADVLVEQFRPGVMERLGLGYDHLHERFPGLVYCSITGFGQTGERAHQAGHDLNYLALSGLLAQSCGSTEAPVLPPVQIADIGGGSMPAVINILLALLQRDRTGQGCHLDIAMTEAMFAFGVFAHAQYVAGQEVSEHGSGLLTGGSPRYRLYPAKDGRMIAVAALEEKFWQELCDVLEIDNDHRDDRRDPGLSARAVGSAIAKRTAEEWAPVFAKAECCACLVAGFNEAMQDPAFADRGLFDRVDAAGASSLGPAMVPIARVFRDR